MTFRRLLPFFVLLLVPSATSQMVRTGNVKIRVTDENDRAVEEQVHLQLMESGSNSPVSEGYTSRDGMMEFNSVAIGNYHVVASGEGIETADSGMFEVDARKGSQFLYIRVRRIRDSNANPAEPGPATVSATDLNVPEDAKREFDKANELMAKEKWDKALEHLTKAVRVYPQYAAAYNNIGVSYARLGKRAEEREALNKAVGLDDHFASAYTNLARMSIVERDFPAAEGMLNKAITVNPNDVSVLILLANVELLNKHYDDAIANAHKAHTLADTPHALAHYIAARAYGHKSQFPEQRAELELFLKEEPEGPRADAARKEMAGLQAQVP